MSGGYFDYNQHQIRQTADEVESLIHENEYPPEIMAKFKKGLKLLLKAEIYVQRIDWLVSGDDGEENFLIRLKDDLKQLKKSNIGGIE